MTRKDYELNARVVSTIMDNQTRETTARAFVKMLLINNPRFKPMAFLKACNVEVTYAR